jgi:ABC-type sugar transport system permease subunit
MKGFRYHKLGYASAMAIVLFIVAFTVILFVIRRTRSFSGDPS